jgi:hypothetical protein
MMPGEEAKSQNGDHGQADQACDPKQERAHEPESTLPPNEMRVSCGA